LADLDADDGTRDLIIASRALEVSNESENREGLDANLAAKANGVQLFPVAASAPVSDPLVAPDAPAAGGSSKRRVMALVRHPAGAARAEGDDIPPEVEQFARNLTDGRRSSERL
jgi:hypothetical protein